MDAICHFGDTGDPSLRSTGTAVLAVRPARSVIAVLRLSVGYGAAVLHPAERALIRGSSPARCRDFVAGRAAAADALRLLGRSGPVLREARRPLFPTGVRGSISHCRGAAATCLATTRTDVSGVGVDVERVGRLSPESAGLVCTPREQALVAGSDAGGRLLTVMFSAKEAFYKAATALALPREPVFHDLEVLPDCAHESADADRSRDRSAYGKGDGLRLTPAPGLLPDGCTVRGQVRCVGPYVWTTVLLRSGNGPS
ncbi:MULTISPECIES: 4'-phosphopantetheinyl transferase superfamily protein [unclassified Streptomyces]|uniref:4'-phosphopantetheinyl transferase superfamily protein n=1 Tax=unclassified Streptomyces TaxID=2593676 RepID=UPI00381EE75A